MLHLLHPLLHPCCTGSRPALVFFNDARAALGQALPRIPGIRYRRSVDRTQTLSVADDAAGTDALESPHLFLVLESHRMASPPARIRLAGLDEILFGRGESRQIQPAAPDPKSPKNHALTVRAPDPWMSSTHARMMKALKRWVIEEPGSKTETS